MAKVISYEVGNKGASRRRLIKRLIFFSLIVLTGYLFYTYGPAAWERINLLVLQRRVMAFSFEADTVIYKDSPDLLTLNHAGWHEWRYNIPNNFSNLCDEIRPPVRSANVFRNSEPTSLLFLRRLESANGGERIVMIGLEDPDTFFNPHSSQVSAVIIEPGSILRAPRWIGVQPLGLIPFQEDGCTLQFFDSWMRAGSNADFVIPYEFNGKKGELGGSLSPSGDKVDLHGDILRN